MTTQLKIRLAILIVVAVVILIIARLIGLSAGKTKLVSRDGGSSPPSHAKAHKNNPAGEFLDLFVFLDLGLYLDSISTPHRFWEGGQKEIADQWQDFESQLRFQCHAAKSVLDPLR